VVLGVAKSHYGCVTTSSASARTAPATSAVGASSTPGLIRAVGTIGLAASIFNCTVGGGIFRLPAGAAAAAGPAAPYVYLICGAMMACVVLCFAEAGSRVPLTGGPYAYVEAVFGPYVGFLTGMLLWLLGTAAVAGVSSAYADGVSTLLNAPAVRVPTLIATFTLLCWVNVRGVREGTRVVTVVSIAKLLPLLAFVCIGAFFIVPANLAVHDMPAPATMARAAIILTFAFFGVESALVTSGEVKDPVRAVPRALAIAMTGVTLLYLSVHLVAQGVLGPELATVKTAPLAFAAERFLGTPGRLLLLIGATISMFGYVSGMTLAVPRALWKFAQDGLLPPVLGRVHPTFRTPYVSLIVQSVLVCVLAVFNSFEQLAIIANVSALLLYAVCAIATLMLRQRNVRQPGALPFSVPGGPIIPVITVALITWMLTSITRGEWSVLVIAIVLTSVLYVVARRIWIPMTSADDSSVMAA